MIENMVLVLKVSDHHGLLCLTIDTILWLGEEDYSLMLRFVNMGAISEMCDLVDKAGFNDDYVLNTFGLFKSWFGYSWDSISIRRIFSSLINFKRRF